MADADRLSLAHQENVISLLAYSDQYGKIVAEVVEPDLFEGDYRDIAERLVEFWKENGQAPKAHTHDLFSHILEDSRNRRAGTYKSILSNMLMLSEDINPSFVINELTSFRRIQMLKDTIIQAAERLQQPSPTTINEVEDLLHDILRARDYRLDVGMRVGEIDRLLEYLSTQHVEFSTGIKELDEGSIVPYRKAVMMMLAAKGAGKSWFLVNIGKHGIIRRKKVLHVTLENSEELTAQRYLQAMFAIPTREAEVRATSTFDFEKDRRGRKELVGLRRSDPPFDFTFENADIRSELNTRILGSRINENLVIKGFPSGKMTMNMLESYLDSLSMVEHFEPDIMLLDYIGVTKTDAKDKRGSLGQNLIDYRAICIERNIAGATAHQLNRGGIDAKQARATTHVSEDLSLIFTADTAISMSATMMEKKNGLARLFVDHARAKRDGFGVLIAQNYSIGQFVLDSLLLPEDYFEFLDQMKSEGDYEDNEEDDD